MVISNKNCSTNIEINGKNRTSERKKEFKHLIGKELELNERIKWATIVHGALNKSFINEREISRQIKINFLKQYRDWYLYLLQRREC